MLPHRWVPALCLLLRFLKAHRGSPKQTRGSHGSSPSLLRLRALPPPLAQLCRPVRVGLAALRLLQMCHRRICQLSVAPRWPLPRCHQSFVIGGPALRGLAVTFSHWRARTPVTIDNAQMAPKSPVSASFARLSPRCQPTGTQETCRRYQHNAAAEKATYLRRKQMRGDGEDDKGKKGLTDADSGKPFSSVDL